MTRLPLLFLVLGFAVLPRPVVADHHATHGVYELRTYYANEGKLDALHARFRDHTCALFEKHGIHNVAYWVPVENKDNTLVYLVAYPSREAREKAWKAFFADPDWKAAYQASTKDGKLVAKVTNTFLSPTDYSPKLEVAAKDPARLFEMRTYTTLDGRLANLNARFRDHTCALFEKHGITNVLYTEPMEGEDGAGTTLVYFIAHKDEDARKASFSNFGKDPAWQSARKASTADGPILVKGGVKSVFLAPVDYSPLK